MVPGASEQLTEPTIQRVEGRARCRVDRAGARGEAVVEQRVAVERTFERHRDDGAILARVGDRACPFGMRIDTRAEFANRVDGRFDGTDEPAAGGRASDRAATVMDEMDFELVGLWKRQDGEQSRARFGAVVANRAD